MLLVPTLITTLYSTSRKISMALKVKREQYKVTDNLTHFSAWENTVYNSEVGT